MRCNAQGSGGNAEPPGIWKGALLRTSFEERPIPFTESGFVFYRYFETYMTLHDKFGRQITDLRISVTDRCNFRCVYCRSADPENYREHDEILSWPELHRLAGIFKTSRHQKNARNRRRTHCPPRRRRFHLAPSHPRDRRHLHDHQRSPPCRTTPEPRLRRSTPHQHQPRFARPREIRAHHPHQVVRLRDAGHPGRPGVAVSLPQK